jgi:dTDP-4-dehydrorhamnose reductase
MDKKIIVLGSKGMLGQMVIKYFGALGYSTIEFNERISEHTIFPIIKSINKLDDSVVINCIGKIKQKSDDVFTLLWSNSILPMELSRSLKKTHFLIQPSTDCVFTGNRAQSYDVNDFNDAEDVYGWSKSLGEHVLQHRTNTLIVRVSIIGPDYNSDKGLLSWFLNLEEGSTVNGFTNHFWNGITTLEWCKRIPT